MATAATFRDVGAALRNEADELRSAAAPLRDGLDPSTMRGGRLSADLDRLIHHIRIELQDAAGFCDAMAGTCDDRARDVERHQNARDDYERARDQHWAWSQRYLAAQASGYPFFEPEPHRPDRPPEPPHWVTLD